MRPIVILFLTSFLPLSAQIYENNHSQHRFAQTYVGLGLIHQIKQGRLPSGSDISNFKSSYTPRFAIGGLHFWGHLDFNIGISVAFPKQFDIDSNRSMNFINSGDFTARYYPWAIKDKGMRPFIGYGMSFLNLRYEQKQGSRNVGLVGHNFLGGLSYRWQSWQLNLEYNYLPSPEYELYTDLNKTEKIRIPQHFFGLSVVKFFDTTLPEERRSKSGYNLKLEKEMRKTGTLNSLSVGIAPSTSFHLFKPRNPSSEFDALAKDPSTFNWDIGLGYLISDAGLHLGLSYRNYSSSDEAFELESIITRRSIAGEAFMYFFEYNGFKPFIGPSVSYETWAGASFRGEERLAPVQRDYFWQLGLLIGWDIMPSSIDTWTLRTNIRYYPNLQVDVTGNGKQRADQLEFNFIQFVFFPQRWYQKRKAQRHL